MELQGEFAMLDFRNAALALVCASVLVSNAPARASQECKGLRDFERDEGAASKRKYVDSFQFRKNRRGDSVLLLFKDTIERGIAPKQWLFLHRPSSDRTDYCVAGRGEGFGQHDDSPQDTYFEDYGAEGSGHRRCATSTANLDAGAALRASANRALGDGVIVLYTEGLTGPGFQFAIGPDHDWVIIQDDADLPRTSCFFDSGTDVLMRFNNEIPVD
jgi:hypothetical protein